MDDSSCQKTISKSDPAILNYYRQLLIKGFGWWKFEIFSYSEFQSKRYYTVYYQLDLRQFFVITSKADKAFDYEGLEQAIYEAVSSYGIDNTSHSLRLMIEFIIPEKEFSVASVQFLTSKLLISVNTIVQMSRDHQIVKSLRYFWRWTQ